MTRRCLFCSRFMWLVILGLASGWPACLLWGQDQDGDNLRHWAYQPPSSHQVPEVAQADWPYGALDAFVLERLEQHGLRPVEDADRVTLVRRLYYDLLGLPPTPAQIEGFVSDARPDAYQRLVERLLAAPQFGERWGRHWLDVARFAESVTLRGFVFPEAWRYRDYVISAFNRDLSYDQFVRQQIAGDLLEAADWQEAQQSTIATTFLMLGNINYEEQDKKQLDMDVVDEQLDTLGKAFLAQTIGCARCHDHKFDPIPTRDYYALAGILRGATALEHANVSKWIELPLPVSPEQERVLQAHEERVAKLEGRLKNAKQRAAQLASSKSTTPDVLSPADLPGIIVDSAEAKPVGAWKHSQYHKRYIGDGYLHDINEQKGAKTLTFQADLKQAGRYEVRLAYISGSGRAADIPVTILHADGETVVQVDQQESPPIDGRFVSLGQYRFERGNQGYVLISTEQTEGYVTADAVQFLSLEAGDVAVASSPAPRSDADNAEQEEAKALAAQIKRMEQELKKLAEQGPQRPKAMMVRENEQFQPIAIHHRGSVHTLGPEVPRGFLTAATQEQAPAIPSNESGRRQLARWLSSSENPLTARVMVNRVWHWLMGAGLVRTTDNFGTTGELPSHPELLDYLAVRFMEEGWSIKELVRQIVLSRTYRLAAVSDEYAVTVDPENRLCWRMSRRRLEAECIRDAMLLISGELSLEIGGRRFPAEVTSDYGYRHDEFCRSVYVPVFRNALPDLFEVFDFPDPSMVSGRRHDSIVAPQALFFMNHSFALERSQAAARRLLNEPWPDDQQRLRQLYLRTIGRPPSSEEFSLAMEYLGPVTLGENSLSQRVEVWAGLFQAVMASSEFRYLE